MMGHEAPGQGSIYYYGIHLENRVRKNHPLRKIRELIDFQFTYDEVKDCYGANGNVSVPPPVILKLMLLLVLYNVRSERELMETLPERLDWLWFLGYDLDSEVPDHSVLSKARARWRTDVFRRLFERVVTQCVEAGLVNGDKLFVDASLIDANASNASLVSTQVLSKAYQELEQRLDEHEDHPYAEWNTRFVSATDPDASLYSTGGQSKLRYKTHRAVDGAHEVITAVEVTSASVNEAHRLLPLLDIHAKTTSMEADTVIADSKYGTVQNFLDCADRNVEAHIPPLKKIVSAWRGIFREDRFSYDAETDTFTCPKGTRLKPTRIRGEYTVYRATKSACSACDLNEQCTKDKTGRTVWRHSRQEDIDRMVNQAQSPKAKRSLYVRQHLMERSFARSLRYGYKKARWRRLWKVYIQELLVATVLNILTLVRSDIGKTRLTKSLRRERIFLLRVALLFGLARPSGNRKSEGLPQWRPALPL